jgi:hypothetical protein
MASRAGSHHTLMETRRLQRHDTCIVSYRRVGEPPLYADCLGEGRTFDQRVKDADAKLPAGEWLRTCVSTPASIFGDLYGRYADQGRTPFERRGAVYVNHERQVVIVP